MLLNAPSNSSALATYLSELRKYPLLKSDEERELALRFRAQGEVEAAHRLITSNLRFVVKVAYEYRSYGLRMADLIQEGNIGLMKGVQKFDPSKGIRLISYAVWWIRAYIQNYILRSWSLVKLGTTQAQRKLFFSLARTKREIQKLSRDEPPDARTIAKKLRVKPSEVAEMERRIDGRDLSLDAPMGEEGGSAHVDFLASGGPRQDDELSRAQEQELIRMHVQSALSTLDHREKLIIEKRLLADKPMTLRALGNHFGFSRERARQLEIRARERLRARLCVLMDDGGASGGPARPMQAVGATSYQ